MLAISASSASAYTINTTELGKRIRWGSDTVTLQIDPALDEFLPDGGARAAVEMGLDAWRGLPRVPDLVLREDAPRYAPGHHGKRPTNGVYLLEDWPYEREKLAITVITYEMETGRLLDADVLVNGEARFALLDERARADGDEAHAQYDLAAVMTHETGHMLGLGESDADPKATMWPYAVPGETQKRTIEEDDEEGAITSYLSAPPEPVSGCGTMSVASRRSSAGGLLVIATFVFVLGLGAQRTRRRALLLAAPLCLLASIVGWGEPVRTDDPTLSLRERVRAIGELEGDGALLVASAARGSDPELRLLAVEKLAERGTRDEAHLLERLAADEDPRIAARAHVMLRQLLARAPRNAVPTSAPEARARLSNLYGRGEELVAGRAKRIATIAEDGLLFTEYTVRAADGREATLRVAGGTIGAIGQRALHGELPPEDEQQLVVVPQPDGQRARWAYAEDGKLFGGDLGEGPAIVGAL